MGSVSAMSSIDRVLKAHGEEIRKELMESVKDSRVIEDVRLGNNLYGISWRLFNDRLGARGTESAAGIVSLKLCDVSDRNRGAIDDQHREGLPEPSGATKGLPA